MKDLKTNAHRKKAILEAIKAEGGRRVMGREIAGYFAKHDMNWVPLTVEPWRPQKPEGVVRSVNLFVRDKMRYQLETLVIGTERLHSLKELKGE